MADYIKYIRGMVGHAPIILNNTGGLLFNEKGQVLLQERNQEMGGKDFPEGSWSIPGGFLEYGETFDQALRREFLEDTGIEVQATRLIGVSDDDFYKYPNGDEAQGIGIAWEVEQIGGAPYTEPTEETRSLGWFDLDDLPNVIFPQNVKTLELARKQREQN